jgi:hypothetical protein
MERKHCLLTCSHDAGLTAFIKATMPVTWEAYHGSTRQTVHCISFSFAGDHAASMFNPGKNDRQYLKRSILN